jgi:hypothetical protein
MENEHHFGSQQQARTRAHLLPTPSTFSRPRGDAMRATHPPTATPASGEHGIAYNEWQCGGSCRLCGDEGGLSRPVDEETAVAGSDEGAAAGGDAQQRQRELAAGGSSGGGSEMFNEMATLLMQPQEHAIKQLFARSSHGYFSVPALARTPEPNCT